MSIKTFINSDVAVNERTKITPLKKIISAGVASQASL